MVFVVRVRDIEILNFSVVGWIILGYFIRDELEILKEEICKISLGMK